MGRKRYKDQILLRILEVCAVGATKTQVVYNSGLNFHTVVPYLELIIRNDLAVKVEGSITKYKATTKGMEALEHFRELEELIPELGAFSEKE